MFAVVGVVTFGLFFSAVPTNPDGSFKGPMAPASWVYLAATLGCGVPVIASALLERRSRWVLWLAVAMEVVVVVAMIAVVARYGPELTFAHVALAGLAVLIGGVLTSASVRRYYSS
jgi:hypothetical protein